MGKVHNRKYLMTNMKKRKITGLHFIFLKSETKMFRNKIIQSVDPNNEFL